MLMVQPPASAENMKRAPQLTTKRENVSTLANKSSCKSDINCGRKQTQGNYVNTHTHCMLVITLQPMTVLFDSS